ncbi:MAG: ATP-dependent DNA helicase RecG [Chitinophagales bacterium]|nr:ATP-dependent DNA helicase RecG [Chitinophagales bacterium]
MQNKLHTNIEYLKGVGPKRAEILQAELNIFTWGDLLHHFPFRYVDKSKFYTIEEIDENTQFIQIKGRLSALRLVGAARKMRLQGRFEDSTGSIDLVWFAKTDWIQKSLKVGADYIIYGKPNKFGRSYSITHPEIKTIGELKQSDHSLEPVYSTTEKLKKFNLDSKGLSKLMYNALELLGPIDLNEVLPLEVLDAYKLLSRNKAYHQVHFPTDGPSLEKAIFRIKFEELLLIQLRLLRVKINRNIQNQGFLLEKVDHKFKDFYENHLPFALTEAQKRVLKEIRKDTLSGKQMNRLLQGDVGSGKTIVSLLTMLMAIDNGFQACIMAPTEILAQQHMEGISELIQKTGITCALLTGSVKGTSRKQLLLALSLGEIDILIGTHALIEDPVVFKNLGMVVVDEQHRFGVAQRAKLWKKNTKPPHNLVMTATPIPRTLAMTLYGDLDVSIIDELPPGRKPIKTIHRRENSRLEVFGFIAKELEKGRQAYLVYPLIEESETLDFNHLMDGYESVKRFFPQYSISMVHGKMKPADKEFEMQRFVKGKTQIMVATTVIEVGVNVPNASIMVIESAERFGLSQLHQLRGRVGRGADQSYCILMTGLKLSTESKQRMAIMVETNDGFRIAEEDLKLRGPGDIEGTQQSGVADLKLASLVKDSKILALVRQVAIHILQEDPFLDKHENKYLKEYLIEQQSKKAWGKIA